MCRQWTIYRQKSSGAHTIKCTFYYSFSFTPMATENGICEHLFAHLTPMLTIYHIVESSEVCQICNGVVARSKVALTLLLQGQPVNIGSRSFRFRAVDPEKT